MTEAETEGMEVGKVRRIRKGCACEEWRWQKERCSIFLLLSWANKPENESEEPRQGRPAAMLTCSYVKAAAAGAGPRENGLSNHSLGTMIAFTWRALVLGGRAAGCDPFNPPAPAASGECVGRAQRTSPAAPAAQDESRRRPGPLSGLGP